MQTLHALLRDIPAPDAEAMAHAQQHIDGLLKPPGSLGRLEALAVQLAGMPGLNGTPQVGEKAMLVMCADHGVWDEGVAVSPKIVTAIQAANMTRGTTGVCVLAAQAGAKVHVIDVGIDAEPIPGVVDMRVARGCGNIAVGPAMSRSQAEALLLEVSRYTCDLAQRGVTLFGVGELGMANTTPAAAMVSVLQEVMQKRWWGLARIFRLPASIIKWTSCGGRLRLISPIRAMALMCCRRWVVSIWSG